MNERDVRMGAAGFLGGLLVGLVLWSREQHVRQRELFSRSPARRLAALTFLRGAHDADAARLLAEYIRWEPRSSLRRRARSILEQVEQRLD